MCPPERPRSGVSIPKTHALCAGDERWMRPCGATRAGSGVSMPKTHTLYAGNERWMRPCGATRAGTQAPPLPISTKPRGVPPTALHCTFDSSKPCGVALPRSGYTFDSAGLASATQPTLGNNASEEATPLGVVLFLIAHHYHTRRMNDLPHAN